MSPRERGAGLREIGPSLFDKLPLAGVEWLVAGTHVKVWSYFATIQPGGCEPPSPADLVPGAPRERVIEVAGQKSGKSKRPQSAQKKIDRAVSRRRAEQRHEANHALQAQREQANRTSGGPTPWALACAAREERRAILDAAYTQNPWSPGNKADRDKSVWTWIQSHKDSPMALAWFQRQLVPPVPVP